MTQIGSHWETLVIDTDNDIAIAIAPEWRLMLDLTVIQCTAAAEENVLFLLIDPNPTFITSPNLMQYSLIREAVFCYPLKDKKKQISMKTLIEFWISIIQDLMKE